MRLRAPSVLQLIYDSSKPHQYALVRIAAEMNLFNIMEGAKAPLKAEEIANQVKAEPDLIGILRYPQDVQTAI